MTATLERQGWVCVETDDATPLCEIADAVLGGGSAIRGKASTLAPLDRVGASPFSLSAQFGLSAFDAHTDGAAEPVPPRWCFLRLAAGARAKTPTLLWDVPSLGLPSDRLDALRRAMWVVHGGPVTFYSSILRRHGNTDIVRFNRVCMEPVSRAGAEAGEKLASVLLLAAPVEHEWRAGEVLIIDNWRVVHARPSVGRGDAETRRLERLLVVAEA